MPLKFSPILPMASLSLVLAMLIGAPLVHSQDTVSTGGAQTTPTTSTSTGNGNIGTTADLKTIDPLQGAKNFPYHPKPINSVTDLIGTIVWAFPSVMGTMAFLQVIIAGFLMVTAAGEEEKIERAKKLLFYIAVSMGALAMAYGIISFVIFRITHQFQTQFSF